MSAMHDAVPPYARIKDYLKRELSRGRYPPGSRMPSESELTHRFDVSRMTVNRALRELVGDGLVVRVQGVGTFSAQPHRVASTLTIRDIHEEILSRGHEHLARVHVKRAERAKEAVAARLGLRAGDTVFHTLIVHCENGVPLQCEDRYVNPGPLPDYLSVDFTRTTPTAYLLSVAPLWVAEYSIAATTATTQEARLLEIEPKDPCLVIVRRTENHHLPTTIARLVHPGSRYLLEGRFKA